MRAYQWLGTACFGLALWQVFTPNSHPNRKLAEVEEGKPEAGDAASKMGPRWVDAFFRFDFRKKPKAVSFAVSRPELLKGSEGEALYKKLVDPSTGYTLGEFRVDLRNFASTATQEQSIALMAKIGRGALDSLAKLEHVREGRDTSRGVSEAEMFRALRGERKVGNCSDIHNFVRLVAIELGFEDVGTNTVNWDRAGASGNHAVVHYRNKLTGEYLVQSYGEIIETRQKILLNALDVTAQTGGSFTNSMWVETEKGAVRLYQPRVSRWVRQVIESESGYKATSPKPLLTLDVGNLEKTVGLRMGVRELPHARAFFAYSSFETSNGPTSVLITGLSGELEGKRHLSTQYLDEVGYAAHGYLGINQLKVSKPENLSAGNTEDSEHSTKVNAFFGASLQGYARLNRVTGKLELQGNLLDMGIGMKGGQATTPWHSLSPRVEYQPTKSVRVGVERSTFLVSRTINDWRLRLGTAYDKLDLVYDKRFGENKFYLVSQTSVFLFEGVEKMSAIGIKEHLKAIIPADRLGYFTVLAEASRVFGNRDDDPFYEAEGTSYRLGTGWQKGLGRFLQIGADLKLDSSARPFFALEEPGSVTPELGRMDGAQIHGDVWLRTLF